mgnify:FL=1
MAGLLTRLLSGRRLMIFVGCVTLTAFTLGCFTLALLLGVAPLVPSTPGNIVFSLNANLVAVVILAMLIAIRVVNLFRRRRRGGGGARLHTRIAVLFGLVAAVPSILLVIFSVAFLHVGLEQWFGQKVEAAVGRSLSIATAYLREHRLGLVRDTYAVGSILARDDVRALVLDKAFDDQVRQIVERRGFSEIVVFTPTGAVLAKAGDVDDLKSSTVPNWALHSARTGERAVVIRAPDERMRALLWLPETEQFLLAGRALDPSISRHVEGVNTAVGAYREALVERTTIEARLSVLYLVFGVTFLLASIWAGLMFANALAEPISNLIQTADRVRAGDLSARAPVRGRGDEIGNLLIGFNRMTAQLERQRDELIAANAEMDERRRFIGAVLAGVTSGVLSLDDDGIIRAANRYAEEALAPSVDTLVGKSLQDISPEMADALAGVDQADTEIRLVRNGRQRVLLARAAMGAALDLEGQVITFTDITDLVAAKRQAAWSGVARRVAHEIKNPLTPIQLAAERLKRRYLKAVGDDSAVFQLCCDTIIRQVAALRGMVDEFSDFARLPTPVMQTADMAALCQEVIFLLEMQHKHVAFTLDARVGEAVVDCDPGQITRALNNVLINAVHAVQGRAAGAGGSVTVSVSKVDSQIVTLIEDNGDGFPIDLLESVVEPYVTTKEDGSGLGLAIVQRILEEHGGALSIRNRGGVGDGAAVEFRLLAHGEKRATAA